MDEPDNKDNIRIESDENQFVRIKDFIDLKRKVDKIEKDYDRYLYRILYIEQMVELNKRLLLSNGDKKVIQKLQNEIKRYKNKIANLVHGSDDVIFNLMKENERLRKRIKLYESSSGDFEEVCSQFYYLFLIYSKTFIFFCPPSLLTFI